MAGLGIELSRAQINQLTAIARMAIGSGEVDSQTVKGGSGRIGMLNGHTVKFNTHLGERVFGDSVSQAMRESCNDLRRELYRIVRIAYAYTDDDDLLRAEAKSEACRTIREALKLRENGEPPRDAKLLDRQTVASVINRINRDADIDIWSELRVEDVRSLASGKLDMSFNAVRNRMQVQPHPQEEQPVEHQEEQPVEHQEEQPVEHQDQEPKPIPEQIQSLANRLTTRVSPPGRDQLKTVLAALDKPTDPKLSEKHEQALERCRTVNRSFNSIYRMTTEDLAQAVRGGSWTVQREGEKLTFAYTRKPDVDDVQERTYKKTIRSFLDAQKGLQDLGDLLMDLYHASSGSNEALEALLEMKRVCDAREVEMDQLIQRLRQPEDIRQDAPAPLDLKQTVGTFLVQFAHSQHGNEDVLTFFNDRLTDVDASLNDLRSSIERADTEVSPDQVRALHAQLSNVGTALQGALQQGIPLNDQTGLFRPEPSILRPVCDFFNQLAGTLHALSAQFYETAARNLAREALGDKERTSTNAVQKKVADLETDFVHFMKDELTEAELDEKANALADRDTVFKANRPFVLATLKNLKHDYSNQAKPLDAKLIQGLFRGDFSADTYLSAKSWRVPDDMFNHELDDGALIKSESLGNGGINTVFLCTYRMPNGDEKQYVFKPELAGHASLNGAMQLNADHDYEDDQTLVQLNFASRQVARLLGNEQLMPEVLAGKFKGQFGLFMSVAPGVSPDTIAQNIADPDIANPLAEEAEVRTLFDPPDTPLTETSKTVLGTLARETSDLDWNDLITGQGDRHTGNYHVKIGPDHQAHITGVDNDAAFPPWRLGTYTFRLTGKHLDEFVKLLGMNREYFFQDLMDDENQLLKRLPGKCRFDAEKQEFEIDLTPQSPNDVKDKKWLWCAWLLARATGVQKIVPPQFISRRTYERLEILSRMPVPELGIYLAHELKISLGQEQLVACHARIQDAWHIAQKLDAANRVKDDADWTSDETMRQIRSDCREAKSLEWPLKPPSEILPNENEYTSNAYVSSHQHRNHPSWILGTHLQGDILVRNSLILQQEPKSPDQEPKLAE